MLDDIVWYAPVIIWVIAFGGGIIFTIRLGLKTRKRNKEWQKIDKL